MLEMRYFREQLDLVKDSLTRRGVDPSLADRVLELDLEWRRTRQEADKLRHERNEVSVKIARLKKEGKDATNEISRMKELSQKLKELEEKEKNLLSERDKLRMRIPNLLHKDVPEGESDEDNVPIRFWGEPRKPDFELKTHWKLLEDLDLANFEKARETSGRGFYYLLDEIALLDLALQRFAIEKLVKKGFRFVIPPYLTRRKVEEGATQLEDFEEVIYKVEGEDLYLIPTAEHPLVALHMNEVLREDELPRRYVGLSPCFRKEAGTHSVDEKGLFRVHQFHKVEQVSFTKPEDSWEEMEFLISNIEEIFQDLGLAYRVVDVCSGDLGAVAARKYDIEAWFPKQGKYREVGSCSNILSYQATRLNIRVERKDGNREYLHTLNSTAIATGRAIAAIIENYQTKDGFIEVPDVLVPYLGFEKIPSRK